MTQRRLPRSQFFGSSILVVAIAVALVGVFVSMAWMLPPKVSGQAAHGTTPGQGAPAAVDPQFLPTILTSPNATFEGHFGVSVATSGSTVVVGAPSEEGYARGLFYDGRVYVENTVTGQITSISDPSGGIGDSFGASVALGGGLIVVGAPAQSGDAGHVDVFNAATDALVSSLKSPNAPSSLLGFFGQSVAISGNLIVVGAPYENVTGDYAAGHAYLINALTGSTMMLSSPVPQAAGHFGWSVGISGSTIVVGAPGDTVGGQAQAGHVYVFSATTGDMIETLTSSFYFTSGIATAYGGFGSAVAINGSIVIVGAPGEYGTGNSIGVAYQFDLLTNSNSTLFSPAGMRGGFFGSSVAIDSNTVLIGAPYENSSGQPEAGNAYLYSIESGDLISSNFAPPDWPSYGEFGYAVAESSTAVVVGAPDENATAAYEGGHAFIFNRIPLTLASPRNLFNPELFGHSVSIDGAVVVGAPDQGDYAAGGGPFVQAAGDVYVFPSHTGPVITLRSPNAQLNGLFGLSVAIWGYTVVVGAPGENSSTVGGHAYIFNLTTGALIATLTSPHAQSNGAFGFSVATNGNLVAVGAPGEANTGSYGIAPQAGYAYVFNATTGALVETAYIGGVPAASSQFGYSVALSTSKFVVGAPGVPVGATVGAGRAYVFPISGGIGMTLASPNPQTSGGFGTSVATSGGTVVVGAPSETSGGFSEAGRAYIFSATTGNLLTTLTTPNPTALGFFGQSVADNGPTIVVGAFGETAVGLAGAGNVYLFNSGTGALFDRYNSPNAQASGSFGGSVAIGPAGAIVVGAETEVPFGEGGAFPEAGFAYLFFL
jgi:hypothetical protein